MKSFFRSIHLYLGLAAGLVIMLTCFTGAVLIFEKELEQAFHPQRYQVKAGPQRLSLEILAKKVKKAVPDAKISGFKVYGNPNRSVEVSYGIKDKQQGGKKLAEIEKGKEKERNKKEDEKEKVGKRKIAFVNPYTGAVLDLYAYNDTFFYQMFALHRWLLGGDLGKLIVGVSTLFFVFILITGFILWWPKTRSVLKQRLLVKWDSNWKRLNNDLHIVLGFYSSIFLFVFAFTGLAWSFDWFNKGIYTVTRSEMKEPKQVESVYVAEKDKIGADAVLLVLNKELADIQSFQVNLPKDSVGTYTVNILPNGVFEMQGTTYWVDAYSATVLDSQSFEQKNLGQRVRSSFKPIHTASIFGLSSKIIGLIACLLGVIFPITGFIMWRNRVAKKN
ncbi:MAG: PepSY-associated TM helix domain-containing protein [Sphingobacteriaceae bacterium]